MERRASACTARGRDRTRPGCAGRQRDRGPVMPAAVDRGRQRNPSSELGAQALRHPARARRCGDHVGRHLCHGEGRGLGLPAVLVSGAPVRRSRSSPSSCSSPGRSGGWMARRSQRVLLAGAFLTAGYIFQTWGLQGTSASKAAFITGMFVVITPMMQTVLLRRVPRTATIVGALAAVVGLWLLSGGSSGQWTAGDTRVLLCAVAYSCHLITLGSVGARHDVTALTLVQLATVAVACGAVAILVESAGSADRAIGLGRPARHWSACLGCRVRGSDVRAALHPAGTNRADPRHRARVRRTVRLARGRDPGRVRACGSGTDPRGDGRLGSARCACVSPRSALRSNRRSRACRRRS